jgi:hypothetical protein
MQPAQQKSQGIPNDPIGQPGGNPPRNPVQLILGIGLLGVMLGVFLSYARSSVDWEILQTKHYWSAEKWYYGGYAAQYFETPKGYETFISEGLCNYTNMLALQEQLPAGRARHPVQGFPGTERLATPFLVSALLHAPGESANAWGAFWQANVLLWILSVYLAYKVAALFFADRFSPWFAAIFVALYPALTVTFNAIKQQPLGTAYLLLGMYLFEGRLGKAGLPFKAVALTAIMFFGQFADGGWCFLAAFIFLRAWWLPGRERWATILWLGAAVGVSGLWLAWLRSLYHLPSVTHALGFSFGRMLGESWTMLASWFSGADVSQLWFLNLSGATFFSVFWPAICEGFLSIHAVLLIVAVAGLFFVPRTRMFTVLVLPMLFVGHLGTIMAGWLFYYGYASFPAAVMVILAASGVLGRLAGREGLLPRAAALALAASVCLTFTDLKKQAGIYYGQGAGYYRRNVEVRYGNETEPVDY